MTPKTKHSAFYNVQRFLPYYKNHKKVLALDLICAMLTTVCELVFPLIVSTITDQAVSDPSVITFGFVLRPALFYVALRLVDAAHDGQSGLQGFLPPDGRGDQGA